MLMALLCDRCKPAELSLFGGSKTSHCDFSECKQRLESRQPLGRTSVTHTAGEIRGTPALPDFAWEVMHPDDWDAARRAERDGGGGFTAGFLVGGAIFGVLGFLFAPQACPSGVALTFGIMTVPVDACKYW